MPKSLAALKWAELVHQTSTISMMMNITKDIMMLSSFSFFLERFVELAC